MSLALAVYICTYMCRRLVFVFFLAIYEELTCSINVYSDAILLGSCAKMSCCGFPLASVSSIRCKDALKTWVFFKNSTVTSVFPAHVNPAGMFGGLTAEASRAVWRNSWELTCCLAFLTSRGLLFARLK